MCPSADSGSGAHPCFCRLALLYSSVSACCLLHRSLSSSCSWLIHYVRHLRFMAVGATEHLACLSALTVFSHSFLKAFLITCSHAFDVSRSKTRCSSTLPSSSTGGIIPLSHCEEQNSHCPSHCLFSKKEQVFPVYYFRRSKRQLPL
jgi:hypothetical protein